MTWTVAFVAGAVPADGGYTAIAGALSTPTAGEVRYNLAHGAKQFGPVGGGTTTVTNVAADELKVDFENVPMETGLAEASTLCGTAYCKIP